MFFFLVFWLVNLELLVWVDAVLGEVQKRELLGIWLQVSCGSFGVVVVGQLSEDGIAVGSLTIVHFGCLLEAVCHYNFVLN